MSPRALASGSIAVDSAAGVTTAVVSSFLTAEEEDLRREGFFTAPAGLRTRSLPVPVALPARPLSALTDFPFPLEALPVLLEYGSTGVFADLFFGAVFSAFEGFFFGTENSFCGNGARSESDSGSPSDPVRGDAGCTFNIGAVPVTYGNIDSDGTKKRRCCQVFSCI